MLLKDWGYAFECVVAPVSEHLPSDIGVWEGVRRLAEDKARAGLQLWLEQGGAKEDISLGADTMVVLDGKALGKPASAEEAVSMLNQLSGREHSVLTGVALIRGTGEQESAIVETKVRFRKLTGDEIIDYVKTGEPLDKAGAYGIQGQAGIFVESYTGSLSNVIGLPMEFISDRLKAWGILQVNIALRGVNDGLQETQGFTRGDVSP